jgi:putative FmdB family regulatory protein
MPIYEYYCEKCEKTQDLRVNFSDADEQYCKCSDNEPPTKLIRVESFTNNAFHLKGTWFKTRKTY